MLCLLLSPPVPACPPFSRSLAACLVVVTHTRHTYILYSHICVYGEQQTCYIHVRVLKAKKYNIPRQSHFSSQNVRFAFRFSHVKKRVFLLLPQKIIFLFMIFFIATFFGKDFFFFFFLRIAGEKLFVSRLFVDIFFSTLRISDWILDQRWKKFRN